MSAAAMSGLLGTAPLTRLALRRDRVLLPVWLLVFAATAGSSASATVGLYPTESSRVAAAAGFNETASLVALYGRIYDPTSLGALAMLKLTAFGAALVGLLSVVVVVRHTRAEEEAGRTELLGATVVGRRAPLAAALLVALGTNAVLALVTALALRSTGLPATGSVAFGLAWAGTGVAFAGVAAVVAQLTTSARAAVGISSTVLGAAYLLRAVGDATGPDDGTGWVSWLSPVGWGQQVRPYAGDRFGVLLLPLLLGAALAALAAVLVARRDVGAGLLADRPGRPGAGPVLAGPLGLAWRLHRGALLGWTLAFVVLGLVVGGIASGVEDLLDSEQSRDFIRRLGGEKGLSDAFLATELGFVGLIASAYGVSTAGRMRAEETAGHAELQLSTATTRTRWAASHLVLALLGATALLVTAGLSAGVMHAAQTGDSAQVGRVLAGALVQLPAAWVLTGVVAAAFGVAPRLAAAGWAALVVFLLIGELGPLFELRQWVLDLSPYAHVPRLPGSPFAATPLLWLTLVALALTGVGLIGFRRRDLD